MCAMIRDQLMEQPTLPLDDAVLRVLHDRPSPQDILDGRSERGGWTRAQLAEWGVPWPPPKGWRKRLEDEYRLFYG